MKIPAKPRDARIHVARSKPEEHGTYRRSVLALALATAEASPALLIPTAASAQRYPPDEGKELAPGARRVDLSKHTSEIPAYKSVALVDLVFQLKPKFANSAMASDMVCDCLEGELSIDQGTGKPFVAKTGDVWTCKTACRKPLSASSALRCSQREWSLWWGGRHRGHGALEAREQQPF